MDKSAIIETLKRHRAALERQGVQHAALFGSRARDEADASSDIDIMIDLDPETTISVFDYVGLKLYIAELFDRPVDVVNRQSLRAQVGSSAMGDAIYAF